MVFSSVVFLFMFLPLFLAAYYLTPARHRNTTALLGSCIFYAWGAPRFLFVLLGSAWIDYRLAQEIYESPSTRRRKLLLGVSLVFNLGLLGFFKYANFSVDSFNELISLLGISPVLWANVVLPIGISFFTFQKISYVMDVYRGQALPAPSYGTYALYLIYFPQLIAGPIIRYHDVAGQLAYRSHSLEKFLSGGRRFAFGLAKKALLANALGEVADVVFGLNSDSLTIGYAWLGTVCYAFQIYFDFSGYSDMAIGLGRMCGFEFMENFNRPYLATSFTDFWKRWHISLSNFMREYLYIPLGGNRGPTLRVYANLWIVFLLSGLWHGAAWQFILWGAYNGFFLTLDKAGLGRLSQRLPRGITIPVTFVFVLFGWVLFRAENLPHARSMFSHLFALAHPSGTPPILPDVISRRATFMLVAAALTCAAPLMTERFARPSGSNGSRELLSHLAALFLMLWSLCSLINASFNPFIYFRF